MATFIVFAAAIVVGLQNADTWWVFLLGVAAGALVGLIPQGPGRIEALGAAGTGLLAVVSGMATGWGWLESSGVVGAALAVIWALTGQYLPGNPWRWVRWGGVVFAFVLLVILPLLLDGGTLGNDESAYGVKAKSWLEGTPDTGWHPHRATGMSVYGYLVLAVGGAESGLRLIGLLGLLAMVLAVWLLGDRMGSPRVAGMAAIGIIAGPALLRRSTEYLSDVPSAALLVFGMVIVWREFAQRDLPSYRLLWFLPFAWVAFYLRYQTVLSLGVIAVATSILWWPKIRQRPGPVLALLGIGLIGLIPHFLEAIAFRGTPWSLVAYTSGIAERAFVGEGLVDYAGLMTWQLGGFVAPIASIAAIWGLFAVRKDRKARQRYLFLLIPALLQVLALGLLSHGEPRFVFFPLALIIVAGSIAIDWWLTVGRRNWARGAAIALGMLVLGSIALSADSVRSAVGNRAAVNLPLQLAAEEARLSSGDATCAVMTTPTAQVTFYSECSSHLFEPGLDPILALAELDGEERYMILVEGGRRQPNEAELAALIDLTEGEPVLIEGARVAALYTFDD